MAWGHYDVALTISLGTGEDPEPAFLVGEVVPVRIAATVEGDRAVAQGVRLEVRRPDGIAVTVEGRDLADLRINLWGAMLGCDIAGTWRLNATCRAPTAARAAATLVVRAAADDPPPPPAGPILFTEAGRPLLTQDARPLTA